jgi:hypothetical protein
MVDRHPGTGNVRGRTPFRLLFFPRAFRLSTYRPPLHAPAGLPQNDRLADQVRHPVRLWQPGLSECRRQQPFRLHPRHAGVGEIEPPRSMARGRLFADAVCGRDSLQQGEPVGQPGRAECRRELGAGRIVPVTTSAARPSRSASAVTSMMQRIFIAGHRFTHLVPLHRHADDGHWIDLALVEGTVPPRLRASYGPGARDKLARTAC